VLVFFTTIPFCFTFFSFPLLRLSPTVETQIRDPSAGLGHLQQKAAAPNPFILQQRTHPLLPDLIPPLQTSPGRKRLRLPACSTQPPNSARWPCSALPPPPSRCVARSASGTASPPRTLAFLLFVDSLLASGRRRRRLPSPGPWSTGAAAGRRASNRRAAGGGAPSRAGGGGERRLGAPAASSGQGAAPDESCGPTMDDGTRDLGRGGGRRIFASPLSSHPK
jgi:hypothetical protein